MQHKCAQRKCHLVTASVQLLIFRRKAVINKLSAMLFYSSKNICSTVLSKLLTNIIVLLLYTYIMYKTKGYTLMNNSIVQITSTLKILFAQLGQSMREYKWQKRNTTEKVLLLISRGALRIKIVTCDILFDFSLTVKAVTLIFISGRCSACSSVNKRNQILFIIC